MQGAVPATYVRLLFDYLAERGFDGHDFLGMAVPDARARVPVAVWRDMLSRASERLSDPLLGLHLGREITPAHFGPLGYVFFACDDLGAALERLHTYQRLVYDVNPMGVAVEGAHTCLCWGQSRGRPGPLVDEAAVTALVQFARDMTGTRIAPAAVDFINPRPADTAPYEAYFGCPVAFGRDVTRVVLPTPLLALPLRRPDPALRELLEREARERLSALPDGDDLRRDVRRAVLRLAREGRPDLPAVAAALGLSERTLHRRLAGRGINFRRLRDETLRRAAEDYLADPGLRLADVALLLGYSEQSAFNRAFRRWTGRTPGAYRASLRPFPASPAIRRKRA
ncbi:AraC family transcriptional regulator [Salinisphaera sp. PC39]|uniref:AraC family transcriptional regulator n=1 Tax=Salinisphaera sp. PC39 TaxID=1304156 RepID=UPI003341DFAE